MKRSLRVLSSSVVAAVLLTASQALAIDSEDALKQARAQISAASAGVSSIQAAIQKSKSRERTPQQRLADAVLLVGSKDYARATTLLNEIVEKYPDHPTAYPDALTLLGETYYRSKQYLSARRTFRAVVDRGSEPRFAQYQPKALTRLVDVALRTRDYSTLDEVFTAMNKVAPSGVTGALAYARGKGLFAKKDFGGAKSAFAQVDPQSEFQHQAKYFLGLIEVREATPPAAPLAEGEAPPPVPPSRYTRAIDAFEQVTKLPADTPEHKRVIDLAWIAIGRLFYETAQYPRAVQAYNRIDRSSAEFGSMLYELAWVYVRLGDVDRAQRALEVLAIADPNSQNIADGSLLRADLMLRAGQFEKSLKVYEGVRATYDPMREKIDAFLGQTSDPAVYYDKLAAEHLDALDNSSSLPALAVQWAREAEDGPAAFAVLEDVKQCRELIKQSNELIEKVSAVLNSPNRVRAFPELKAGEERALSLINRIGHARLALGQGMDDVDNSAFSGELGAARKQRRALEKRLAKIPVTESDFSARESQAVNQWNGASQKLQRLNLQVDQLQATVNGLRRLIRESPRAGVVRDPATVKRYEDELANHEREIATYRAQTEVLRKAVAAGKMQVGFGDQRFVEDAEVRKAYRDALNREVSLASGGAGGSDLAAYARRVQPLLRSADSSESTLEAQLAAIEKEVEKKTTALRDLLAKETANVVSYGVQLDTLDSQARLVVGEVAMRNFGLVRDRFKNIVLRADVGITEEAWEVREEQMTRVKLLQIERRREDRLLTEELNEVLDDSGESEDSEEESKQ